MDKKNEAPAETQVPAAQPDTQYFVVIVPDRAPARCESTADQSLFCQRLYTLLRRRGEGKLQAEILAFQGQQIRFSNMLTEFRAELPGTAVVSISDSTYTPGDLPVVKIEPATVGADIALEGPEQGKQTHVIDA